MRVSEIRVKRVRVNQGLGKHFFQPMTSQLLHFDELLKRNVASQNFVTPVNTCSLVILKQLIWSPFLVFSSE